MFSMNFTHLCVQLVLPCLGWCILHDLPPVSHALINRPVAQWGTVVLHEATSLQQQQQQHTAINDLRKDTSTMQSEVLSMAHSPDSFSPAHLLGASTLTCCTIATIPGAW